MALESQIESLESKLKTVQSLTNTRLTYIYSAWSDKKLRTLTLKAGTFSVLLQANATLYSIWLAGSKGIYISNVLAGTTVNDASGTATIDNIKVVRNGYKVNISYIGTSDGITLQAYYIRGDD